jgi:hypothetical protein
MSEAKQKVIDNLNNTLRILDEARKTINPNVPDYAYITARAGNIRDQIVRLRDSYGQPIVKDSAKHPLVAAVEAILPDREVRFDFMRAYDQGVRESLAALEGALGQGMSFGWVVRRVYKEGDTVKHLYVGGSDPWHDENVGHAWTNIRCEAEIFPTDFVVTVLEKLAAMYPENVYEARELFTAV